MVLTRKKILKRFKAGDLKNEVTERIITKKLEQADAFEKADWKIKKAKEDKAMEEVKENEEIKPWKDSVSLEPVIDADVAQAFLRFNFQRGEMERRIYGNI